MVEDGDEVVVSVMRQNDYGRVGFEQERYDGYVANVDTKHPNALVRRSSMGCCGVESFDRATSNS